MVGTDGEHHRGRRENETSLEIPTIGISERTNGEEGGSRWRVRCNERIKGQEVGAAKKEYAADQPLGE